MKHPSTCERIEATSREPSSIGGSLPVDAALKTNYEHGLESGIMNQK